MADSSKRKTRIPLAFKLAVLVLSGTAIAFGAAFYYNYHQSRYLLLRSVERQAENLTHSFLNKVDATLEEAQQVPDFLAHMFNYRFPDEDTLDHYLDYFVSSSQIVYGAAVAFEPYAFDSNTRLFARYAHKTPGGGVRFMDLDSEAYDYLHREWYARPKERQKALWSEPYYDEGGGETVMATYSAPFMRRHDHGESFAGVVTVDIALEELQRLVEEISEQGTGKIFLLSRKGAFIATADPDRVQHENIFTLADKLGDEEMRELGRRMISGGQGIMHVSVGLYDEPCRIFYTPLQTTNWSLGVIIPEKELLADLHELSRDVLLIGCIGFAVIFMIVVSVSLSITRPIKMLASRTREIARGNLEVPLPLKTTRDEVGDLARSFDNMRLSLKEYIANLTETTKAKERMEAELKIARTIQMNFLPRKFTPSSDNPPYLLHGMLEPAQEVGGDLYDYFQLDGNRLFVMIGDVSDKGVPAALFMAVTRTLVKGIAAGESDPAQLLDKVNQELGRDNESMMFVTMFCGILDFSSGEFVYSNAGHNVPLVLQRDGEVHWLDLPAGVMLGVNPEAQYASRKIRMQSGDKILTYTDGVTEAMNSDGEMYTDARLLAQAWELRSLSPDVLSQELMRSVHSFAGGAMQSDDITILALEYIGSRNGSDGENPA